MTVEQVLLVVMMDNIDMSVTSVLETKRIAHAVPTHLLCYR